MYPQKYAFPAHSDARNERPAPKLGGKRERTRKKILEAAFGLIGNEKGLTVRIEEICAAADISRGTFYNYFTSLEQLFEVSRDRAQSRLEPGARF